jgi:hypothetical protein
MLARHFQRRGVVEVIMEQELLLSACDDASRDRNPPDPASTLTKTWVSGETD